VHKVHSKGQSLFDSLMKWIERFLTEIREGIGASIVGEGSNKISLETLLPAGGEERARIMEEIDKVMHWHYLNKVTHEEKLRSRFRRAQKGAEMDADAEDEATRNLINGLANEFDFGDMTRANADELAAEESDDDYDDEDEDDSGDDDATDEDGSEYETDSNETGEERMPMNKNLPDPPVTQVVLSRTETVQVVIRSTGPEPLQPSRSQSSPSPQAPTPRPRTLSLRSSKSMKLLGKFRTNADAPPVPPLPIYLDKQLPSPPSRPSSFDSPAKRRSTGHFAAPERRPGDDSSPSPPSPRRSRNSRKKAATATQPPELKYIPTLLPIFVEMMRPLLRSRS